MALPPPLSPIPSRVAGTIDMPARGSAGITMLTEPVSETILRDVRKVGVKLKHVLLPRSRPDETLRELRDWDLWGPLVLCLCMSILLSIKAPVGQTTLVFAAVFVIVWVGAAVVTVNAQLLGGNLSFFQSVCVLGYCIFPLTISALLTFAWANFVWKALVVAVGFFWATRASVLFMSQLVPDRRQALAAFPVFLFYTVLAWMILIG